MQELNSTISAALESGDFSTAMPVLEGMTEDQLSDLALPHQRTPLHYACQSGRVDIAESLINSYKCNVEGKDAEGCTPLHVAAKYGQVDVLNVLLRRLFSHDAFHLGVKVMPGGKLVHALIEKFQQKLKEKHRDCEGNTPLHIACINGQLRIAHFFIRTFGCDPDHTNTTDMSCLHLAAQHGHLSLVFYLVQEVKRGFEDILGRSPAYLAAEGGHLNVLRYLIEEQGTDPQFRVRKMKSTNSMTAGRSLLHTACRGGHLMVAKYLVEQCMCDTASRDDEGYTSLHLACQESHQDIVVYLLTEGHCDPSAESNNGTTCFHFASISNIEIVKYLHVYHSCQIKGNNDNDTPLHFAVDSGKLDICRYLIENMHCDPNIKGNYARTPLHLAIRAGHINIVRYLVDDHQCDVNCTDEGGITPLHSAASEGNLEVVEYLINEHHSNVLARNEPKNIPLHYAAHYGHLDVVKLFIEQHNCSPQCKGQHKRKPLHFASSNGHLDVVKYLVGECHCDPLCNDKDGITPLHRAAANGHASVIRYFMDVVLNHDLLVRDIYNKTPIHYAAQFGCLAVVKLFIEELGTDPDIAAQYGKTPLFYAIEHKHFKVCEYLIDHEDCNIFAKVIIDAKPTNPMMKAVDSDNVRIIKYICATRRLDGYPAIKSQLISRARNDAIRCYINNYIDPLHQAAKTGDMQSVKYYIEKKRWSPLMLTTCGDNALHTAALHGQLQVVKYLTGLSKDPINKHVQLLCDPRLKNRNGRTAEELALQNNHNTVALYLRNITQSALQYDMSHCLNVFVVGNSKSGKSTLIEALRNEGRILGKKFAVRGITALTPGIIPTMFTSKKFGKANFYDFAGHPEYYASHEIILHQTNQPLVLLTVDVSLTAQEVEQQVRYWVSILSSCSIAAANTDKTMHVIVVCSHWDKVKGSEKGLVRQNITSLLSQEAPLRCHGLVLCDCRYPDSNGLTELRQKLNHTSKEIFKVLAPESDKRCASLLRKLPDRKTYPTIMVKELLEQLKSLHSDSELTNLTLLIETCKNLSSYGHLFFLQDEEPGGSLLILNPAVILAKVHACFKPIKKVADINGLLDEHQLESALGNFPMKKTLAIEYLIFNHLCTKMASDQLLNETYYFFPNLVSASRPENFSDNDRYSKFYTWCLKCTSQFFTPLFLHTMFIELVKCGTTVLPNAEFQVWLNGILVVYDGTRSIIEVTDQTTKVSLAIQCVAGHQSCLVKQRSLLVSLIKSLARKVCPSVNVNESLFPPSAGHPSSTNEIPMAKVMLAITMGHEFVPYQSRVVSTPEQVLIKELLQFDALFALRDIRRETLQDILNHSESSDVVPSSVIREVHGAVEECSKLAELFTTSSATDQDMQLLSYSQLFQNLSNYSILLDRNLIMLGIPNHNLQNLPPFSDEESCSLTIDDLYFVNVNLISVVHLWREVGLALGMCSYRLDIIRINNEKSVEDCFTKVLAAWLKQESHDSPTTWKGMLTALWRCLRQENVNQLVEKLARMERPEDTYEPPTAFFSVDDNKLDSRILSQVHQHVFDLNHKWFHLGLSLGLPFSRLEAINAQYNGVRDCMEKTLSYWLEGATVRGGPPTWRSLTLALTSPLVNETQVAWKILNSLIITF